MSENDGPDDRRLIQILKETRTIAMVGASPSGQRDSHAVMHYLQHAGYRVIPVNPNAVGQTIHGEPVVAALAEISQPFELVDVFRRPDALPDLVRQLEPLVDIRNIRCLWLQLGVVHEKAAGEARTAGLEVVMNRCLKVEHRRLLPGGIRGKPLTQ